MKFGLEKEFFVLKDGEPVLLRETGLPHDSNGLLAEARGTVSTYPMGAVFNLLAECEMMNRAAARRGYELEDAPYRCLPPSMKLNALRYHTKGVVRHRNLYGHETHATPARFTTAGVHISITSPEEVVFNARSGERMTREVNKVWDFPHLFHHLDVAFASEIKAAKRRPGFYEIKECGRVEYRSLPANVDLIKVGEVLGDYFSRNEGGGE